jgi:hypothetical protein
MTRHIRSNGSRRRRPFTMLASSRSRAPRVLRQPKLRTSRPRSSLSTPICGQRRSEPSSSIRRSGRLRCGHASTALRVDRPRPPSVVDTGWVPDLVRATRSASDDLTLVVEDVIRPFDGEGRMREMHLHDLPWPAEVLAELGEAPVTLSYFVEPNPGRRGWTRRYSYDAHRPRATRLSGTSAPINELLDHSTPTCNPARHELRP